jgi:prepilin-type N-terminal cleavage/methylation domain-containing protein
MDRRKINFRSAGFTLIELMVSVAMVLVLIVGVNFVFQTTTDAISAGQAAGAAARDSQAAQTLLFDDFKNVSKNPPCFIIASQLVTQFLNTADAQTGDDPRKIVLDTAGNFEWIGSLADAPGGAQQLGILSPAILNTRSHRCDLVRFFARGNYHRRSANDGSYTSPTTSNDAFITLGHVMLPTKDETSYIGPVTDLPGFPRHLLETSTGGFANLLTPISNPPTDTGPDQRVGAYACDWVLGRSVTLLRDQITNPAGASHETNYLPAAAAARPYLANMTPLGHFSKDDAAASSYQSSRYDLSNVTPEQFRRSIANEVLLWNLGGDTGGHLWWNPLVYDMGANQTNAANAYPGPYYASGGTPPANYFGNTATNAAAPPIYQIGGWTGAAFAVDGFNTAPNLARMAANPQITTPLTSTAVAQLAPYFMQHCTQFIVEYAGDYLQQDGGTAPLAATGAITGIGPDGQIDYVIVTDSAGNRYKKIRWYGMPRSSNGGTPNTWSGTGAVGIAPLNTPYTIRGYKPGVDLSTGGWTDSNGFARGIMEQFVDVIPLRDYYSMYYNTVPTVQAPGNCLEYQPPWEVDVNFDPTLDYGGTTINPPIAFANGVNNKFQFNNTTIPTNNARYVAAWYDDMPAMIRILIKVDDPNNKLKDGPWYEFVFRLK